MAQETTRTYSELYEDVTTGQTFTKPGPNRVRLVPLPSKLKDKDGNPISEEDIQKYLEYQKTPLPGGFANTPQNPIGEKWTIVGRVQFRGVSGQKDTIWSNGHSDFNAIDWNLRRARIGLIYQGDTWWGTAVQLRLEDITSRPYTVQQKDALGNVKDVQTKDNRGALQEANIWVSFPWLGSRITIGQMPMAFAREWLQSSANLINLERSFLTNIVWQMDMGGTLRIRPLREIDKKYEHYLEIQGGIYGGHGSGLEGFGRLQNATNTYSNTKPLLTSPLYTWRVVVNPFGGLVKDGKDQGWYEGEEIFQREMKLSLGMGAMQTKNLAVTQVIGGINQPGIRGVDPINALLVQTTPDNGYGLGGAGPFGNGIVNTSVGNSLNSPSNTQTTSQRPSFGLVGHTYDFTFTVKGFYLSGQTTFFSGSASKQNRTSQVTFGYNIPIGNFYLMPVFRADFLKGDYDLDGKIDDRERFKSVWFGLNFFGDGHLFKAQLFYQMYKNQLGFDPIDNSPRPLRDDVVYFQLQGSFWTRVATKENMANLHE